MEPMLQVPLTPRWVVSDLEHDQKKRGQGGWMDGSRGWQNSGMVGQRGLGVGGQPSLTARYILKRVECNLIAKLTTRETIPVQFLLDIAAVARHIVCLGTALPC